MAEALFIAYLVALLLLPSFVWWRWGVIASLVATAVELGLVVLAFYLMAVYHLLPDLSAGNGPDGTDAAEPSGRPDPDRVFRHVPRTGCPHWRWSRGSMVGAPRNLALRRRTPGNTAAGLNCRGRAVSADLPACEPADVGPFPLPPTKSGHDVSIAQAARPG
jgi:hypothetical protein